jgi:hypothetical protein
LGIRDPRPLLALRNMGWVSGIPRPGIRLSYPRAGSRDKKSSDPGSGSMTLDMDHDLGKYPPYLHLQSSMILFLQIVKFARQRPQCFKNNIDTSDAP